MEMGHGDEIVLADGNFPAASNAHHLINAQGHGTKELLKAILALFPLDTYVASPVMLMDTVEGDPRPDIWDEYGKIITETSDSDAKIEKLERYEFYSRSRNAYVIVATSERSPYANIILKKGVL